MIIVAGHLAVAPADRDRFVAACIPAVVAARAAPGCLHYSVTADTVDPARVVVYERWEREEDLLAFRGSGPSDEQQTAILDADVQRYGISSVGDP